jgi:prevent-host-death family protein
MEPMMRRWQFQEAKARLSEVVKSSADGPQEITVHGKPAAVVVSKTEFDRLARRKRFVDFMRESPLSRIAVKIKHDKSRIRKVSL